MDNMNQKVRTVAIYSDKNRRKRPDVVEQTIAMTHS